MKNRVLVVAAHPDDEVLGAAGTILKHVAAGDGVSIFILGEGETSRKSADVKRRAGQARRAAKLLGAETLTLDKLPDQRFDTVPFLDIVQRVEALVNNRLKPDIIYTHCPYDLNLDHRITFKAVLTACRPGYNSTVRKLSTFETLSSTEWQLKDQANSFCPSEYNDITPYIDGKVAAMRIYLDEIRSYPHPRSVEGIRILAQYRGMEVGYRYAEAFQLIRLRHD